MGDAIQSPVTGGAVRTRTGTEHSYVSQSREKILERISKGLVYTETEAAFQASQRRTEEIFAYNHTPPNEPGKRRALLEAILGSVGERTVLLPPFHAGFGSNGSSGERVVARDHDGADAHFAQLCEAFLDSAFDDVLQFDHAERCHI